MRLTHVIAIDGDDAVRMSCTAAQARNAWKALGYALNATAARVTLWLETSKGARVKLNEMTYNNITKEA